ncbi:MAG: MmgE/PrpD family protein [Pseudomonadota bacterium]
MTQHVHQFANFVTSCTPESLTPEARTAATVFLMDTVAVGIAGSGAPEAHRVLSAARRWGSGDTAHVLGTGAKLPTSSAAYVNAFQIHCQEYDCLHERATVHAMAVVGGALLAVAEARQLSGVELLLGVALGVEVAVTLGLAAGGGLAFFRPATAGALGASAALARLTQQSESGFLDMWGLTYSQLAGTMQAHVEGSVALPLQIAAGARAAVTSLDLLECGLSGPHDILDGPFGYYALFEDGGDLSSVVNDLGNPWRVTELSHKPFPTGRAAHGALDGLLQLAAEHSLTLANLAEVRVRAPALIHRLVARPSHDTMNRSYARLCLQYLVPKLIRDGSIDLTSFGEGALRDEEVLRFGQRVRISIDEAADPHAMRPQTVDIDLASGETVTQAVPHTLGSPERPLTQERRLAKVDHCLKFAGIDSERASQLKERLQDVWELDDTSRLVALTSPSTA